MKKQSKKVNSKSAARKIVKKKSLTKKDKKITETKKLSVKKATHKKNRPNFLLRKSLSNIVVIFLIILFIGILVFMKMNIIENYIDEKKQDLSDKFPSRKVLIYDGNNFVTQDYPIFREVIFLGDSYTYFLSSLLCEDVINYSEPGKMVGDLMNACDQAVRCHGKYVNIFVGPNDMRYNVSISKFKSDLKALFDKIKKAGKKPIMSSYLKSEFTELMNKEYENAKTVEQYDEAIQEVCKKEKVYYLDVKDINDFHNDKMLTESGKRDMLHFNQDFYVKYMNKLYSLLYDIEKKKPED